ncbi:RagB/SusD family nutrient uptake outer membrane protein [Bacteroides sp. OttesenSCG-928-D19]|nr:RagB/SusD family nutrient uptake outer membrane protein [Bacteroides sp. OttesenSCG-928-N06]MDL2305971.1 RagB/SusD family nutrient uptake outer membrane protein [Bacteroides sp. OttesenSCG-928-D19]
MKTYIHRKAIVLYILVIGLSGCSDFLNSEDTSGIITPDLVWTNSKAIDAVLANLYDGPRLDDFNDWNGSGWRLMNPTTLSDEAQGSFQKDPMFDNYNGTYTYEDYLFEDKFADRYPQIRRTNDFLKQLSEATVLSDNDKKVFDGEVRFLRALHYFSLVKRQGGVPLLTEPQVYVPGDVESLQVPRDKEADVYDFIVSECKEIAKVLPATRSGEGAYRATKGAALALGSRAALYAGSIAKYGEVKINGVVGIPASEANRFFTEAYNISKELIATGTYSLYNSNADKAQNFYDLFSKTVNGDNGEYIFQKQYNASGDKGHDWDKRNAPFSYNGGGWGCGIAPTLELVEAFEYTDGSEGTLRIFEEDGVTLRRFDDPMDLFEGKDPRLFASVYLSGSAFRDSKMEWKRGVIAPDGSKHQAYNSPNNDNSVVVDGVIYNASGKDGGADVGDPSKTGFYQKKFFDETLTDMNMGKSETPWVVFRLAEIYLNLAEACMELGSKDSEALEAVNIVRDRAGIARLTSISMAKVRHERRVELAFEKHRYWDMKRWRIAHLDVAQGGLTNFRGSALYPWYNISDGKYTFEVGTKTPKQLRIFLDKNYYARMQSSDISNNPKLVQNPGYEN